MRRVLDQVRRSLPFWLDDPDAFVAEVATKAPEALDQAFDRWRQLYSAARRQLSEANTRSEMSGLSSTERGAITQAQGG